MGIRINPNTWRQPLRLIDCWLPRPATRTVAHRDLPQWLQRFVRAGWLGHTQSTSAAASLGSCEPAHAQVPSRACRVRVLHTAAHGSRSDARLVISGRMADVCAELERLEALEMKQGAAFI